MKKKFECLIGRVAYSKRTEGDNHMEQKYIDIIDSIYYAHNERDILLYRQLRN